MSNIIWQFATDNFRTVLSWEYERDPDLSWDEDGEVTAKLESGEYVNCMFKVAVYGPNGTELSADYLGNSIHSSPEDFRDHFGIRQTQYGSYFSDMVRTAICEARAAMANAQSVRMRHAA